MQVSSELASPLELRAARPAEAPPRVPWTPAAGRGGPRAAGSQAAGGEAAAECALRRSTLGMRPLRKPAGSVPTCQLTEAGVRGEVTASGKRRRNQRKETAGREGAGPGSPASPSSRHRGPRQGPRSSSRPLEAPAWGSSLCGAARSPS